MEKKAIIKMTDSEFKKCVRELTEKTMFDIMQLKRGKIYNEITNDVLMRIKDEFNDRVMILIKREFEMNIAPYLMDSIVDRVISQMVNNGDVEFIEEQICSPMVVPPNPNKTKAKQPLKELLNGAKTLLINDPYFFSVPLNINEEDYIKELLEILPLTTIEKITIIHQKTKHNSYAINIFESSIPKNIAIFRVIDDSIHDRVWLIDDTKAYLVGTSIGGIGNKLAFILPLPEEDIINIKSWFKRILGSHNKKTRVS